MGVEGNVYLCSPNAPPWAFSRDAPPLALVSFSFGLVLSSCREKGTHAMRGNFINRLNMPLFRYVSDETYQDGPRVGLS